MRQEIYLAIPNYQLKHNLTFVNRNEKSLKYVLYVVGIQNAFILSTF